MQDLLSFMIWWNWGRTNDWTTYWFGWSTTYGWRWWWGLSWVFTWEETITDSQASRVVIIAWWAWWGRTWGWAWGWESWQNWNGGSYWYPWGWWTQTWRNSWGNVSIYFEDDGIDEEVLDEIVLEMMTLKQDEEVDTVVLKWLKQHWLLVDELVQILIEVLVFILNQKSLFLHLQK